MNACPFHKLRDNLPELTERIAALSVDERGYPIPFFVAYMDGKPDFRVIDNDKWLACVKKSLCWVCGQAMGAHKTFLIGPMGSINRVSSEPPTHLDCALWSVKGCPFLSKPNMVRREDEDTEALEKNVAGVMIKRNPGAMAAWTTKTYSIFKTATGPLISIGDPEHVSWWREGRPATRAEVLNSIDTGLPLLLDACRTAKEEAVLMKHKAAALKLLPSQ